MKKRMSQMTGLMAALAMTVSMTACGAEAKAIESGKETKDTETETNVTETDDQALDAMNYSTITLAGDEAEVDGVAVEKYDYTWHCDPSTSHDEVENAPAEYYTGTKPETDAAVYIDHELYYYPELSEDSFNLVNYDGEQEYASYYTDGEHEDYIFATLPKLGETFQSQMMHSEEEAAKNQVLHITKAGSYRLEGQWKGQVWVDLGDQGETFTDASAKVTLIFDGVDIDCSVAPGVVFYSAYECDNTWASQEEAQVDVDTTDAGAVIMIADESENSISGENVYRMLKTEYRDEVSEDEIQSQKNMRKTDGALHSYVTMNIEGGQAGTGTLKIESGYKGVESELHLSVNGGKLEIKSQDDGMHANEDHVSVIAFNGGIVDMQPAQGTEGDGVDSKGSIVIKGGEIRVAGVVEPDSALDSEDGVYYHYGEVYINDEEQMYMPGEAFIETSHLDTGMPDGFGEIPVDAWIDKVKGFDYKTFWTEVNDLPEDATIEDVMILLGMDPDAEIDLAIEQLFGDGKKDDAQQTQRADSEQSPKQSKAGHKTHAGNNSL